MTLGWQVKQAAAGRQAGRLGYMRPYHRLGRGSSGTGIGSLATGYGYWLRQAGCISDMISISEGPLGASEGDTTRRHAVQPASQGARPASQPARQPAQPTMQPGLISRSQISESDLFELFRWLPRAPSITLFSGCGGSTYELFGPGNAHGRG
jgi:hypothetical protein